MKICINGKVYYGAWTPKVRMNPVIVCFDVRSEEITFIKAPIDVVFWYSESVLMEYKGKLASIVRNPFNRFDRFDFWVLEDVEKHAWSKQECVFPLSMWDSVWGLKMSFPGTNKSGGDEIILAPRYLSRQLGPYYIFFYHLGTNNIRIVRVHGIADDEEFRRSYGFENTKATDYWTRRRGLIYARKGQETWERRPNRYRKTRLVKIGKCGGVGSRGRLGGGAATVSWKDGKSRSRDGELQQEDVNTTTHLKPSLSPTSHPRRLLENNLRYWAADILSTVDNQHRISLSATIFNPNDFRAVDVSSSTGGASLRRRFIVHQRLSFTDLRRLFSHLLRHLGSGSTGNQTSALSPSHIPQQARSCFRCICFFKIPLKV
ncbi:unnamed protein product [Microthlaspi erraticum]|uniref:F-box associated beta-propeller type 3 domain-containing protein n=1 Tax=Microthlaspi erraticum TaxID=1685480 RepID=A0A6D2KR63_9BRAS|nr:unnamed protein product [Microthlaspi erraticum]